MNKETIIELLKDFPDQSAVSKYASYCVRVKLEKKKGTTTPKNPWFQSKTEADAAELFLRVSTTGVVFDGEHVTYQNTGISYDYIARKNRLLFIYPESTIDIQLVDKDDSFEFDKENGKVLYNHKFGNPFGGEDQNIVGGYVVIKNNRGEFLTLLSRKEIDKHRATAKTDYIWKSWFREMVFKTLMKKACKYHFEDSVADIESLDNENYNLPEEASYDQSTYIDTLCDYIGGLHESGKLLEDIAHEELESIRAEVQTGMDANKAKSIITDLLDMLNEHYAGVLASIGLSIGSVVDRDGKSVRIKEATPAGSYKGLYLTDDLKESKKPASFTIKELESIQQQLKQ